MRRAFIKLALWIKKFKSPKLMFGIDELGLPWAQFPQNQTSIVSIN
jgi:hypothetical protein